MPLNQPPSGAAAKAIRSTYVLITDHDGDRIARTVRECVDVLPAPIIVVRDGDDAIRMLAQFGPPTLLVTSLLLPGKDGLSVIEALRRIDDTAAVIAWAGDRDVREYAACRVANVCTKVLGPVVSPAVLRRCLDSVLQRQAATPPDDGSVSAGADRDRENWSALAERAQQALGVAGTAVYAKAGGDAKYQLSVVWTSDAPMPSIPELLPGALEEVIADGTPRIWPDLADEPRLGMARLAFDASVRSLVVVPIRRGGETLGALCAFDSRPQTLRQSDVDTLIAMMRSPLVATPVARRGLASPPIDRQAAQVVISREVARVRREKQSLSVILFAASPRLSHEAEVASTAPVSVSDTLAQAVRGNDLVVRWTDSEVLLVLTGVNGGVARRIAERVRSIVESSMANRVAVSGAVTELRTTDSFEATVARAEQRLQAVHDGDPPIA